MRRDGGPRVERAADGLRAGAREPHAHLEALVEPVPFEVRGGDERLALVAPDRLGVQPLEAQHRRAGLAEREKRGHRGRSDAGEDGEREPGADPREERLHHGVVELPAEGGDDETLPGAADQVERGVADGARRAAGDDHRGVRGGRLRLRERGEGASCWASRSSCVARAQKACRAHANA